MSGTASIGSRVKFQAPKTPTPSTNTMISQRWRTEKARTASIMLGLSLAHFCFHDEAVLGDIRFSRRQSRPDFHEPCVGLSKFDRAGFDLVPALANENDSLVFQCLYRSRANGDRYVALCKHEPRGNKQPRTEASAP